MLVLKLLKEKDMYGYEIIQKLEELSEGYHSLKEGTLYPMLYKFEDKGWVESYKVSFDEERKIPRKYYKITEHGKIEAFNQDMAWHILNERTNKVLKYIDNKGGGNLWIKNLIII